MHEISRFLHNTHDLPVFILFDITNTINELLQSRVLYIFAKSYFTVNFICFFDLHHTKQLA